MTDDPKAIELMLCHIKQIESDLGYYDMPECEDAVTVSGKAVCELLDEVKRWRASHVSEDFNPDWCAASEALSEQLKFFSKYRTMSERLAWATRIGIQWCDVAMNPTAVQPQSWIDGSKKALKEFNELEHRDA